jgi:uncharacterized protein (TIRG00374 family)
VKRWQVWLGVLISAFFIWRVAQSLRIGALWQALRDANYLWLIPGIAVYFLAVWARAWRWHYLLRGLKRIPTRTVFPIVTIGYMGNNIYPARAGELLRAYVLRRQEGVPISASLATILVERAFDGIVMLAFVFVNLPELDRLTHDSGFAGSIRTLALWGAVLFAAAVLLFVLMAIFPRPALRMAESLFGRLLPERYRVRALALVERFVGGLVSLRSPADVLMVLLTSIVIWLLETGKYFLLMQGFNFTISFFGLMLMNGIVNLATTIPSAPGYIGTFDAPGIAVLKAYGVSEGIAAGYTLVLHAALLVPITLLGAFFMLRANISWQRVRMEVIQEQTA